MAWALRFDVPAPKKLAPADMFRRLAFGYQGYVPLLSLVPLGNIVAISGRTERVNADVPSLFFEAADVVSAIRGYTYLERMANLEGAICQECGEAFIVEGKSQGLYCETKCANTFRQRRYRRRLQK
jgi:hypothetical protein